MTQTRNPGVLKRHIPYIVALSLALAGLGLSATAHAQSIVDSPHDLTSGTEGQQEGALGGICVYCHTPHGGETGASAPLWNRSLPSAGSYIRYSALQTTTLQGEEAPVGSVSLACLSCHDGSQAMDTVINAPGRGANATITGQGDNIGTGFSNANALIGTDLQDDHPVSIQFCGGGITAADGTSGTINTVAAGCAHGADYNSPQADQINSQTVWWLDTAAGTTGSRERTDIFLYTRSDFSGGNAEPSVECGSCHDPHVNNANNTGSGGEVDFMRVTNIGTGTESQVCLTCHNK